MSLEEQELQKILELVSGKGWKLPQHPAREDLLPFLTGLKTKRLRKKFLRNPFRYTPRFLPRKIWNEYLGKCLVAPVSKQVYSTLSEPTISSRIMKIEPLEDDNVV